MREQGWGYLCRQEEDLVWDVPNATSNDSQSHSWEHIGIVSLPRNEGPAIFQSHALKRTSAGKDPSALEAGRKAEMEPGDGFQAVMVAYPSSFSPTCSAQAHSRCWKHTCSFDQKA